MPKTVVALIAIALVPRLVFAAPATPEPMAGMRIFQERCASCHEEWPGGKNKAGPALFGVIGRPVGSKAGFTYSPVFQEARKNGDVWTRERLDAYLDEPMRMYSHTGMTLLFVNPDEQAELIDYLMFRRPGQS